MLRRGQAIARILINKAAEVNAGNKYGQTPLDFALEAGHRKLATLLRSHGAKRGSELKKNEKPVRSENSVRREKVHIFSGWNSRLEAWPKKAFLMRRR